VGGVGATKRHTPEFMTLWQQNKTALETWAAAERPHAPIGAQEL